MAEPPQVIAARAFVRDLNIVLKLASLYGLEHARATHQFEITWTSLQRALEHRPALVLGAMGDRMVINDASLKPSTVERAFISVLSAAGIASLEFQKNITRAEIAALIQVLAAAKPGQLWKTLRVQVEDRLIHVHVHEFSLTGRASRPEPEHDSVSVPASLAATMFSQQDLHSLLGDPMAMLRAAISSASAEPTRRGDVSSEEQVVSMLRAFTRLGAKSNTPVEADPAEAPEQSELFYEYLRANGFGARAKPEALLKIAETLTIRAALEKYESGDVKVDAVRQMLRRFSQELEKLRATLRAQSDTLTRAGLGTEPYLETLDRQFWDNLPDAAKLKVLLSPDSWCIPGPDALSFLRTLLNRGELQTSRNILENYCGALRSMDNEARARAALAVGELAGAFADTGLLEPAIQQATIAVLREQDGEVRNALIGAVGKLAREAEARHDFEPLRVAWTCANAASDTDAAAIRSMIVVNDRVPDLLTAALATADPPAALVDVLRFTPGVSLDAAIAEFEKCRSVERRERLVRLIYALGDTLADMLRERFICAEAGPSIAAVGLMARVDHPLLEQSLGRKLRGWSRAQQDMAIRQISASGAVSRGTLLLRVLDALDRYVVPLALDEIGMADSAFASDKLMQLARGEGLAQDSPFLRVKAIECITRLEEPSAVPELMNMVTARRLLGYKFAPELRTAALQALLRIVPEVGGKLLDKCGIGLRELQLAPLAPSYNDEFMRQRRFPRVTPRQTILAAARSGGASTPLTIESLSMVGGAASLASSQSVEGEAQLELHLGLRRVRAHALVRQIRPFHVGFELCDMHLDDRYRLRQFLAN